jgi:hypothetical protein
VHYLQKKIYWIDRNISSQNSALRSCYFDGTGYSQVFLYKQIDNHTVSTNVSDLVIDFSHNNTAFFIDQVFSIFHFFIFILY